MKRLLVSIFFLLPVLVQAQQIIPDQRPKAGQACYTRKANTFTALNNFTGGLQSSGANVLTGNQTITLSGDTTGSGATAITTTTGKVNGVSYPSGPSTHQTPVVTASNTVTYKTVPDCTDTSGNHLNYTQSTDAYSCGTSNGVTWPASGRALISNGGNAPTGVAEVDGDCLVGVTGAWAAGSCSTGSGTVTSFSAGNLSPLFTTSVATATTTPALTFSLSNAAANTVLGNNSGSAAAPAYQTSINVAGSISAVPSTLTISTATFTPVAVASDTYRVVLVHASCPCTIAAPSGSPVDGERMLLEVWQSATGSDTVTTWGSGTGGYDFGTTGAPTLSTAANAGDFIGFSYSSQNSKWNFIGITQGM